MPAPGVAVSSTTTVRAGSASSVTDIPALVPSVTTGAPLVNDTATGTTPTATASPANAAAAVPPVSRIGAAPGV